MYIYILVLFLPLNECACIFSAEKLKKNYPWKRTYFHPKAENINYVYFYVKMCLCLILMVNLFIILRIINKQF